MPRVQMMPFCVREGFAVATVLRVILMTVAGFIIGFLAGLGLVYLLSFNTHDLNQEMGMTAIFFTGPIGAVIGFLWGIFRPARKSA